MVVATSATSGADAVANTPRQTIGAQRLERDRALLTREVREAPDNARAAFSLARAHHRIFDLDGDEAALSANKYDPRLLQAGTQ